MQQEWWKFVYSQWPSFKSAGCGEQPRRPHEESTADPRDDQVTPFRYPQPRNDTRYVGSIQQRFVCCLTNESKSIVVDCSTRHASPTPIVLKSG
jgi:hypothetical protein